MRSYLLNGKRGDPILGAILDELSRHVKELIEAASNALQTIEMEAGREIALAIDQFRDALQDVLDKTIKELDKTIQAALDRLALQVQLLEQHLIKELDKLAEDLQIIVDTLPFHSKQPLVARSSPACIVRPVDFSSTSTVRISVKGNNLNQAARFVLIDINDDPAFPRVNSDTGEVYPSFLPMQPTSDLELRVDIPVRYFFPFSSWDTPANLNHIRSRKCHFEIDWKEGIFGRKRTSKYRFDLAGLPSRPGDITILHDTSVPGDTRKFVGNWIYQSSARDGGNIDKVDVPYLETPHKECHVVRGTARIEVYSAIGEYSFSIVSDDADRVQYRVTTIYHRISGPFGADSGQIWFRVVFDESTPSTIQRASESVSLPWRDQIARSYPLQSWQVNFKACDGSHLEIIGSQLTRFILVDAKSTAFTIKAAEPEEVMLPGQIGAVKSGENSFVDPRVVSRKTTRPKRTGGWPWPAFVAGILIGAAGGLLGHRKKSDS